MSLQGELEPTPEAKETWLARTRQSWKIALYGILIGVTVVTLIILVLIVNDIRLIPGLDVVGAAFLLILFGASAFVWLVVSIRCSSCNGRPAWTLMRTSDFGSWFYRLWLATECPVCGNGSRVVRPKERGRGELLV